MKFIGITGGVGAGKSEILSYLAKLPDTRVMFADEIAHALLEPGTECHEAVCRRFAGEDIYEDTVFVGEETCTMDVQQTGKRQFDRKKLAQVIFADAKKRDAMNAIVHPEVKKYVLKTAEKERQEGRLKLLVLEAALLIEEHYDEICDELWYIYTRESVREQRLMASRGYSREKVHQIFASQLPEEAYRSHCRVVIDNNGTVEEAYRQIDAELGKANNDREKQ